MITGCTWPVGYITPATSGVGIHHPRGDLMKISSYNAPLIRADNPNLCGIVPISGLSWVVNWNNGVTEPGSSGSPLFDQNHRIVGQLGGGPSACTAAANCRLDGYGRFDNSWTGGGTNATRLSNWLDPSGSGALTTNTTNISNLFGSLTINGSDNLCTAPNTYNILNLPAGATVAWSITPSNLTTPSTGTGATFTTSRVGTLNGNVTITANISTPACGLVQTAIKTLGVGSINTAFNATRNGNIITPSGLVYVPPAQTNTLIFSSVSPSPQITFDIQKVYGLSPLYVFGNTANFSLGNYSATNPQNGVITILAKANAACSNTTTQSYTFSTKGQCAACGSLYRVSPNPATDAIKIEELDANTGLIKTITNTITAIELTDKMGNIVFIKNFNSKSAASSISIPVAQFKNDIYSIRISNGTEWEVQQIIIQH